MNILILKFPFSSTMGGGEKHTINLAQNLIKKGHKIFLLSSCSVLLKEFEKRGWHSETLNLATEPVTPKAIAQFPFSAPFSYLKLLSKIKKYKAEFNIDTVYCLSLTEKLLPIAGALKKIGINVFWIEHVLFNNWLLKNPLRFLYRKNTKNSHIITVSNAQKKQLTKIKISPEKITTIHHGIDSPLLPPKEKQGFYQKKFIIGTVSRLHKEKGLRDLILAGNIANQILGNIYIIIVGDGEQRNDLIWLAKQMGIYPNTRFTGWQDDVLPWIAQMDAFILPSQKESFGVSALEAYSQKKPIIASKIGGLEEVIKHKKTGILIEPGNPEMIAQAIINLARDSKWRNTLGENGYNLLKEKFTLDKMVNQYEKTLTS